MDEETPAEPAINLSNRLNPNNIHYDRELAARYKRMTKAEKEALWAQDRAIQALSGAALAGAATGMMDLPQQGGLGNLSRAAALYGAALPQLAALAAARPGLLAESLSMPRNLSTGALGYMAPVDNLQSGGMPRGGSFQGHQSLVNAALMQQMQSGLDPHALSAASMGLPLDAATLGLGGLRLGGGAQHGSAPHLQGLGSHMQSSAAPNIMSRDPSVLSLNALSSAGALLAHGLTWFPREGGPAIASIKSLISCAQYQIKVVASDACC